MHVGNPINDNSGAIPLRLIVFTAGEQAYWMTPGMITLGSRKVAAAATSDLSLYQRLVYENALQMRSLGIHMVQVCNLSMNTGQRTYSDDPCINVAINKSIISAQSQAGLLTFIGIFWQSGVGSGAGTQDWNRNFVWIPYQELAGLSSACMIQYNILRAFDPSNIGIFSRIAVTDILENEIGFKGLKITDAFISPPFGPIPRLPAGASELMASQAGNDIILSPYDPEAGIAQMISAIANGTLSLQQIEFTVAKQMLAKQCLGLFTNRFVKPINTPALPKPADFDELIENYSLEGITIPRSQVVVTNPSQPGIPIIPLPNSNSGTISVIQIGTPRISTSIIDSFFTNQAAGQLYLGAGDVVIPTNPSYYDILRQAIPSLPPTLAYPFLLSLTSNGITTPNPTVADLNAALVALPPAPGTVIVTIFAGDPNPPVPIAPAPQILTFLNQLGTAGYKTVAVIFGGVGMLANVVVNQSTSPTRPEAYIVAYQNFDGEVRFIENAVAKVILGQKTACGKLPIGTEQNITNGFTRGQGIYCKPFCPSSQSTPTPSKPCKPCSKK